MESPKDSLPIQQGQVRDRIDALSNTVNNLDKVCADLYNELACLITPYPAPPDDNVKEAEPNCCELAKAIQVQVSKLVRIRAGLEEMISRLEV